MSIEAMKQALEALENFKGCLPEHWETFDEQAITSLRQAIAEAEKQEPVAKAMTAERALYFMERFKHEEKLLGPNEQAAVDFVISMLEAPPQRQPLTDEQIGDAWRKAVRDDDSWSPPTFLRFARAIEAAHGIKGEA